MNKLEKWISGLNGFLGKKERKADQQQNIPSESVVYVVGGKEISVDAPKDEVTFYGMKNDNLDESK